MRVLLAITLGVLLSGCVVGGTYNSSGPGESEDFVKASYQCHADLQDIVGSGGSVSCAALDACLLHLAKSDEIYHGRHHSRPKRVRCH